MIVSWSRPDVQIAVETPGPQRPGVDRKARRSPHLKPSLAAKAACDVIAVHADAVELSNEMTAHQAFDVIARSTLRHFSSNAEAVRELDGEAIHQMRVGFAPHARGHLAIRRAILAGVQHREGQDRM